MRITAIILCALMLSACNATFYDQFNHHRNLNGLATVGLVPKWSAKGSRSYDTCIRCGEAWVFVQHPDPTSPAAYVEE